jgi:RimJ/RimL family protein N-acetyltransferase
MTPPFGAAYAFSTTMRSMWRKLSGDFFLTGTVPGDAEALARHLADGAVARWLLRMPHPYTLDHARHFLESVHRDESTLKRIAHFALRNGEGELVGMVGLTGLPPLFAPTQTPVELGFWVAPTYWGRGLATEAVGRILTVALVEYEIDTLEAGVLDGNERSRKVLERHGFESLASHVDLAATSAVPVPGGTPRWGARFGLTYERYAALARQK